MPKAKKDTHSYKGWLNSDNFMKRCLSVVGYQFVGTLVIYLAALAVFLVFGILFFGLMKLS